MRPELPALQILTNRPIYLDMLNSTLRHRAGSNVSPDTLVLLALSYTAERSTLHQLIESWGYRVEQAESGESVLRAIGRAEPPAIVILEDSLPGLSGLALFHQIDRQSSRRRSWTIMLTSSEHAVAGTNDLPWRWAHVHDVVIQPVDKFELRVCLRAASRLRARYAELDDAMDAARFHSSHDGLTGLWNREYLLKLLFEETDRTQRLGCPLSFMLLDLDHFSRINREHGYDGGDRVLRQLASRFRHCLRSYDITGRCGEDEFLIAMPGCTMEDTRSLAARLREFYCFAPLRHPESLSNPHRQHRHCGERREIPAGGAARGREGPGLPPSWGAGTASVTSISGEQAP